MRVSALGWTPTQWGFLTLAVLAVSKGMAQARPVGEEGERRPLTKRFVSAVALTTGLNLAMVVGNAFTSTYNGINMVQEQKRRQIAETAPPSVADVPGGGHFESNDDKMNVERKTERKRQTKRKQAHARTKNSAEAEGREEIADASNASVTPMDPPMPVDKMSLDMLMQQYPSLFPTPLVAQSPLPPVEEMPLEMLMQQYPSLFPAPPSIVPPSTASTRKPKAMS